MKSQTIIDEMRKQAEEAFASDVDMLTYRPAHHTIASFPLMRTITEESASWCISVRSNSLRSHLNSQNNTLKPSAFYDQARLDQRIAEFDNLLERESVVHTSYRERLHEIRGVFDDFRAHRVRRDAPGSSNLQNLDLEVQVACYAQANVKTFTRLLLDSTVCGISKRDLRYFLRYSEKVVNPEPYQDHSEVLEELKESAVSVDRKLNRHPSDLPLTIRRRDSVTLEHDVAATKQYLKSMLILRYQHVPHDCKDTYCPRLNTNIINRLKPLGKYLRWKMTGDRAGANVLAEYLNLHPVELEHEFRNRLRRLLRHVNVDSEYVKRRLMDIDNIWGWVYAYNPLAHNAQWDELASQFCDDRDQFDRIFSGGLRYACPEKGITTSNEKAKVYVGMAMLRGHFFGRLDNSDYYTLSSNAKSIDRRFRRDQEETRREREQEERQQNDRTNSTSPQKGSGFTPRTTTRLRRWVKKARESVSFDFKAKLT